MKRSIDSTLYRWSISSKRKPLLLRGARQVGKTTAIRKLAQHFDHFVEINFELEQKAFACFESLDPHDIINTLAFELDVNIIPGKTLLFLDEIQACPRAITALRYFYENMPDLHVIAAGSLLEFALQRDDISIPVGRIQYVYLYPCTFEEYLDNTTQNDTLKQLQSFTLASPPAAAIHDRLLRYVKDYFIIGGMPEALANFIEDRHNMQQITHIHEAIMQTYRDDFGKYATSVQQDYLQTVYDKAPGMTGNQVVYSKIDPDARSRELKRAIDMLEYAGLVKRVISTSGSGLPFATTANDKKFKLQFLDIGLVQHASGMTSTLLMEKDFKKLNDGQLAEQFVGQHILAYRDPFLAPSLYFWARDKRNANAEVDFVIEINGQIVPIEVKSGATGTLKSLHLFLEERDLPLGIKISTAPLSLDGKVLNVPFYLMGQLQRLVQQWQA